MAKFKDLTGQTFGRLIVIKRIEDYVFPSGQKHTQWLCQCSCEEHNQIKVFGCNLTNKNTKSCGCLQKEIAGKTSKEHNSFDLESREYGVGWTLKGEEFWFDKEDYDTIKDYCWHITTKGYIATRDKNKKGRRIFLHRLIMGLPSEFFDVDHQRGEKSKHDNRKSNLRIATRSQNNMNSKLSKNNTSGVTGVYWHKNIKKWSAEITINYQSIYLGLFNNFEDAVMARKEAEEKYFGEWSYDNSQRQEV